MKQNILIALVSLILFSCINKKQETFQNNEGDWLVHRKGQIELYTRKPGFKSKTILNPDIQKALEENLLDSSAFTSPNDENIIKILEYQNNYIHQINEFLETDFKDTVKIFLYNLDEYYRNGHMKYANSYSNIIYFVFYNFVHDEDGQIKIDAGGPHEMVHIITDNLIGRAKTRLFGEGYAVAITKNYSSEMINGKVFLKSLDSWHKSIKKNSEFLSPSDLLENEFLSETEFYPQAGLFIDWLFQNYDIKTANQLYVLDKVEIISEFKRITGDSFFEMENKYIEYINQLL